MEIALFTTGTKTILGVKKENGDVDHLVVDSILIFQDPKLVVERVMLTLKYCFDIQDPSKISRMCFGISAIINGKTGQIIKSFNLDKITLAKNYSGYSFKKSFGRIVGEQNVYMFNDAQAIGLGIREIKPDFCDAAVFLIDYGVGVSLIDEKGFVHETELGSLFMPKELRAPTFVISGDSINEMLYKENKDVFKTYTEKLISTVLFFHKNPNSFIKKASRIISGLVVAIGSNGKIKDTIALMSKNVNISKVYAWSVFEQYIDKKLINSAGLGEIIHFPKDENEKYLIPILGCFAFPKQWEIQNRRIEKIEYLSNGKVVYQFDKYEQFENHWNENHSFANPDNEYLIHFSDGFVKNRRMGDVNMKTDLEEFRF